MKKIRILIYLFFTLGLLSFASANNNTPFGARSSGIANASVSLADVWAVQNNQAGLGLIRNINAGVCYQNPFMMKELSQKAFALAVPVKNGTFGLSVSQFGYSLYKQSKYGFAFGKMFGKNISAGVQLDMISTNIYEYGSKQIFCAEAGMQTKPIKNLTLGIHVFNLSKAKIADYNDERIPLIMRLGADYKFSDKVFMALETEKDIEKKTIVKAGIEYVPIKELYLRAGVSSNPSLSCFGIGLHLRQFQLDLSSTFHPTLGVSPQLSLMYEFKKNEKANPQTIR